MAWTFILVSNIWHSSAAAEDVDTKLYSLEEGYTKLSLRNRTVPPKALLFFCLDAQVVSVKATTASHYAKVFWIEKYISEGLCIQPETGIFF